MAGDAPSASIRFTIAARPNAQDLFWVSLPAERSAGRRITLLKRCGRGVYDYLLEREQPTETYVEAEIGLRLEDRRRVDALSFLSDRAHPQWAGNLSLDQQADLIAGAEGLSGRNVDYLRDLVEHLREAGVADAAMERLLRMVEWRERSAGA